MCVTQIICILIEKKVLYFILRQYLRGLFEQQSPCWQYWELLYTEAYNPEYRIVSNTADRSAAVQKVLSITDRGGGGCLHFYKRVYILWQNLTSPLAMGSDPVDRLLSFPPGTDSGFPL